MGVRRPRRSSNKGSPLKGYDNGEAAGTENSGSFWLTMVQQLKPILGFHANIPLHFTPSESPILAYANNTFFKCVFKFLFVFRERGREGEKEGEKHQSVASHMPQLGSWPATLACVLTWNQTGDLSVHRLELSPLSYTNQGKQMINLSKSMNSKIISLRV